MKYYILTVLLFSSIVMVAQNKERFDNVTYLVPLGWQKETGNGSVNHTIVNSATGQYAKLIIYKTIPATGELDADFEKEWIDLVAKPYQANQVPELTEKDLPNNWKMKIGSSEFSFNGSQTAVVLITAIHQKNKMSLVLLTNSDAYVGDLQMIAGSLEFRKITGEDIASSNADSKLFGKWNRSGAVHPSYADAASWGSAGYTSSRYEFKQDSTYIFTERSFRMTYPYIIIVRENGTYNIHGNQLTIIPKKSTIQRYSKKNNVDESGSLVSTQNRPLEKVTYTYQFHYFSGIQEWNLVLQADKPTMRDGDFSRNDTFVNAWYFDQKFIDNELTSPKGN